MFRLLRQKLATELFALFLVSLGFFLLVEPGAISANFGYIISFTSQGMNDFFRAILYYFTHLDFSDILGLFLLGFGLYLVVQRIIYRLRISPEYVKLSCPVCGGKLRRSHRHIIDRIINYFIPVYRYRCRNRKCRWTGLRIRPPVLGPKNIRSAIGNSKQET